MTVINAFDNVASTVHQSLIAGFARVRKCTPEGRAGMALDLQVLHGNIRHLAPSGSRLDLRWGLMDSARHVVKRIMDPRCLN